MIRKNHGLRDSFSRELNYVRFSVTDRCNLRCQYCMPSEGVDFLAKSAILSYEQIEELLSILEKMGMKKLRFTGGEPFIRKDFDKLLKRVLLRERKYSVHITTNASVLPKYEKSVWEKLGSINISLDSLSPEVFSRITRRNMFDKVWGNIRYMLDIINNPKIHTPPKLKINCVVQPQHNFAEIPEFVELTKDNPIEVRFIEPMPFNGSKMEEWKFVSADAIDNLIRDHYTLDSLDGDKNDTARTFSIPGHRGTLGIIPAYSRTMCSSCNRLRINARGELRTCLYSDEKTELLYLLKNQSTQEEIASVISEAVSRKPKDGFEAEKGNHNKNISMTKLGG